MAKPKRMWIICGGILGCGFKFRHVGLGIQLSGDFCGTFDLRPIGIGTGIRFGESLFFNF